MKKAKAFSFACALFTGYETIIGIINKLDPTTIVICALVSTANLFIALIQE